MAKVRLGDKEYEGEEVSAALVSEPWAEYRLGDGTVLKVKSVVRKVFRLFDQYTREGDPVYIVQTTNIVDVSAPDQLRLPLSKRTGD